MVSSFRTAALAAALLAGTAFTASAADLPAQVYKAAPVMPGHNWTGFYVGVVGGYAWADVSGFDVSGGTIGGTVGFNYQAIGTPIVFGLEFDGSWGDVSGSRSFNVGPVALTAKSEADTFLTLRGRVGYAWNMTLLYATGGVAWVNNEVSATATLGPVSVGVSDSKNHIGFVVGGGVEQAFTRNWSGKVEYLYMGLGSETYFPTVAGGLNSGDIDVHTIRAGLNYRFGN